MNTEPKPATGESIVDEAWMNGLIDQNAKTPLRVAINAALAAEREVSHAERKNAVTQLTIARQLREQLAAVEKVRDEWVSEYKALRDILNPDQMAAREKAIAEATKPLVDALQMLHDDIAEYARINHLGGFDNHAMKNARAQLAKAGK